MANNCENCRFWDQLGWGTIRIGGPNVSHGNCRRHAPVTDLQIMMLGSYTGNIGGRWPKTDATESCGDFEEAEKART